MTVQPLTAEQRASQLLGSYGSCINKQAIIQALEAYAAQEVAKVSTEVHAAGPDLLDALEHCLNAMALGETPSGWTDYESWCANLRDGLPHKGEATHV